MSKQKVSFVCTQCDHIVPKWLGCCPECKEWNTIEEQKQQVYAPAQHSRVLAMTALSAVITKPAVKMLSGIQEWDRVTGGGIMPGAFIMLTGDPGIGKSTLLLQIAHNLAKHHTVLYFSSEESLEQVKLRAQRLNCLSTELLFADQANLDEIILTSQEHKPAMVVIDSLQNCFISNTHLLPGSIGQLKEAAFKLMRLAKDNTIAVLLSGHITKDGAMAGPKTLEHMVDAVFYLQGEDRWQTRILRSVKNRFGTINELGFFEMQETGLQEVPHINEHLLQEVSYNPGSVLISYIEGTRPLILELQALTITTKFGMPQRVVSGIDHTQVVLIAAILEKYLQVKLSTQDIFFKVSGGFKIKGSSADLGIALALLSSFFQKPIPEKCIILGEISLTGQIKPINYINLHVKEAEKFSINHLIIAKNQKLDYTSCAVMRFSHVYELLTIFES
ncbi:MAG: DNA repair protein RadA [Candidatus Babeliaceae bacterium]|jgi:DNA repair protein RadA/Sms